MSLDYPCIHYSEDGKCKKFSDQTVTSHCVMGPCHFQTRSNADRIRAMSDEELARQFGAQCPKNVKRICDKRCHLCWLEWLRQPVKEGD